MLNGIFSINDIDMDIVAKAKVVFVIGTFLMSTFDGEQTATFLKKCKELGKTAVLDVCWDSKGQWRKLLDHAFKYIDIFMPSIDEAREISNEENVCNMAERFIEFGVKSVVIKCGDDGCYVKESRDKEGYIVPVFKVKSVIDTTARETVFARDFWQHTQKDWI